jgi:hypothetical protein
MEKIQEGSFPYGSVTFLGPPRGAHELRTDNLSGIIPLLVVVQVIDGLLQRTDVSSFSSDSRFSLMRFRI